MNGDSKTKAKKKFCRLILKDISLNHEGNSQSGICCLIYFVLYKDFAKSTKKRIKHIYLCKVHVICVHSYLLSISCSCFNADYNFYI